MVFFAFGAALGAIREPLCKDQSLLLGLVFLAASGGGELSRIAGKLGAVSRAVSRARGSHRYSSAGRNAPVPPGRGELGQKARNPRHRDRVGLSATRLDHTRARWNVGQQPFSA